MRIVVCDYSGHAFQVQLSRELARRGHFVLHLHFAEFQTPKGRLQLGPDDSETLDVAAISLGVPFLKYSFFRRRFQEIEIGRRFASRICAFGPEVVVGCNLPLDLLRQIMLVCAKTNVPFVFWLQDIYSLAISRLLNKKMGFLGNAVGKFYQQIERRALASSASVIVIAEEFAVALAQSFNIAGEKISVIENWAPLNEIPVRPKSNPWAHSHGLADVDVVLYTGTLGLKHDPAIILRLVQSLRLRRNTRCVVASEGPSADWLKGQAKQAALTNLDIVPFQPVEVYADVLGTADVLIAILNAEAGSFSIPSKILAYLCAGKPIALTAPPENSASQIINRSGAGIAVGPGMSEAFERAVRDLLDNADARIVAGRNARACAEQAFDIKKIGSRFEEVLAKAAMRAHASGNQPHLAGNPIFNS